MSFVLALSILLAPAQEVVSRLFAATADGPFITYSWGEHWSRLRGELRGFQGDIDAFACLGPWVFAGGTGGLYVSEDFGENFRVVEGWPPGAPAVTSLLPARLFGLEPTLFVGTRSGLYRSRDFEWARVGEGAIESAVNDMGWPGPELFVAADSGLYRTVDQGETFSKVGQGIAEAPVLSLAISRFFSLDPTVFAGTRGRGLYKSSDGGSTFEAVGAKKLGGTTVSALVWWGGLLIVGTDDGLFFSDDGGASFRDVPALQEHAILSLNVPGVEADISSDIIVGTERGVFKSSDGGQSFRRVQEGMGPIAVRALATFPIAPQTRERRPR